MYFIGSILSREKNLPRSEVSSVEGSLGSNIYLESGYVNMQIYANCSVIYVKKKWIQLNKVKMFT